MAQSKQKDFVVVGGGISGLLIADVLIRNGYSITLLEKSSSLGGCLASPNNEFHLERGLKVFFDNPETRNAINFLNLFLNDEIITEEFEAHPVTFDKGSFTPFVGFGSRAPNYSQEIDYYCESKRLSLSKSPSEWVSEISARVNEHAQTNSTVTSIKIENGRVNSVTVNGSKEVSGSNFIFTLPPNELADLAKDNLSPRAVQKIAKGGLWSTVSLDVVHGHTVSENYATHVLMGGTDDSEPVIGIFQKPENGRQISQWFCFITKDDEDNEEAGGILLREIKKQIKRAYPEALESVDFERILHSRASHGSVEIKLTDRQTLPGLDNLYIQSPHFGTTKNLIGALEQAQVLVNTLELDPAKEVAGQTATTDPSGQEWADASI